MSGFSFSVFVEIIRPTFEIGEGKQTAASKGSIALVSKTVKLAFGTGRVNSLKRHLRFPRPESKRSLELVPSEGCVRL